jgi:hypothetical protein
MNLPFLEVSLADIAIPTFSIVPFDAGVDELIRDVIDLGLTILESAIKNNLLDITQVCCLLLYGYSVLWLFL